MGSLREKIRPGDLVFIDQFIDFTRHRALTFHDEQVIHTPMAEPFCAELRALLVASARSLKLRHHRAGTVVTIEGPRFSTRAESHMFRLLGADVINMSTVPEVTLAREAGICYQSIAMSTDYDCWKEGEEPVTWEMIVSIMKKNADNVKRLILETLAKITLTACGCGYAAYWLAFAYGLAIAGDDRHLSLAVGLAVGVVALGVIPFVAVAVVAWAWGRRSERHWAKAARVEREPS